MSKKARPKARGNKPPPPNKTVSHLVMRWGEINGKFRQARKDCGYQHPTPSKYA